MKIMLAAARLASSQKAGAAAVAIGGAIGALARFAAGAALDDSVTVVLLCNVAGSFILACAAELSKRIHPHAHKMVSVGFCGGLTTFSTFSKDSFTALEAGDHSVFLLNLGANFALCALAIVLASILANEVRKRRDFLRARRRMITDFLKRRREKRIERRAK